MFLSPQRVYFKVRSPSKEKISNVLFDILSVLVENRVGTRYFKEPRLHIRIYIDLTADIDSKFSKTLYFKKESSWRYLVKYAGQGKFY